MLQCVTVCCGVLMTTVSYTTGGVERAQNWRWKLNTQKGCILFLQMSVDLSGNFWREFQNIGKITDSEKLQIPRPRDLNYLAENARFVAPRKCCKPSPLNSWPMLQFIAVCCSVLQCVAV